MGGSHWSWIDTVVLVVYFGAMASLGPLFAKKTTTTEGYFLGDRGFPGWLVGFSMFATSISSITFVAFPADAYKTAWFRFVLNLTLPVGILMASRFFMPFFRQANVTSAYEYLEGRFGPVTRVYAACAFIIMMVTRISVILYLVSILLHEMTGMPVAYSIVLGGLITSFYTILGGIHAVMWTDFIQALVLWGGGMIALFIILGHLPGGIGQVFEVGLAHGKFGMSDIANGTLQPVPWWPSLSEKTVTMFAIAAVTKWLAEYSADQNVVQRYAASKDMGQARFAMWLCCVLSIPTWALFMFIGTALYVFFQQFPNETAAAILAGQQKAENILPYFVIHYMPAGLTGLVIAGVLAAAMSTLSGNMNAMSAVAIVDLYRRHLAPGKTDRHYVLVAKGLGLVLTAVMIAGAFWLWKADTQTLQDTTTKLTAITAAGLAGVYWLGFFSTRGDDRAIFCGIAFTVPFSLWMALASLKWLPAGWALPIHDYYTGFVGHVMMFVIGYTAGCLLPQRPRDLKHLTVWTQG